MNEMIFSKRETPDWLLAFWKEIDGKTFGSGFDCFAEDATANLGVAEWRGRETIRESLRAFIDTGFTPLHDVTEYWDGGLLKVFRGFVTMTPDDPNRPVVKPVMMHFFYMDEADQQHTRRSIGLCEGRPEPQLLFIGDDSRHPDDHRVAGTQARMHVPDGSADRTSLGRDDEECANADISRRSLAN